MLALLLLARYIFYLSHCSKRLRAIGHQRGLEGGGGGGRVVGNFLYGTYRGRVTFLQSNFEEDQDSWVAIRARSRFWGSSFEQILDF